MTYHNCFASKRAVCTACILRCVGPSIIKACYLAIWIQKKPHSYYLGGSKDPCPWYSLFRQYVSGESSSPRSPLDNLRLNGRIGLSDQL